MTRLLGAAGSAFAAALAGCSSPAPDVVAERQIPVELQPDVAAVAGANNAFAADAYGRLVAADPGSNLVFSPFSMSTAFAMLDAGARGVSDTELRAAFHVTLPGDRAHAAYGAMLASLATGRSFGQYTLATANKLFGQQSYPFLDSFLTVTRDDYDAELLPVDFANDAPGAIQTIDQWVSEQTDGKIPMLFQPGDLDGSTVLAIVNAILFKGNWAKVFEHDATHDAPFATLAGSTVQAPLMTKEDSIKLGVIPGGQIAVLPFAGNDIDMVILLPREADGLPALEAQLTGDAVGGWIADAAQLDDPITVSLPKFAVSSSPDLQALITALGVPSIFDSATADLSGIDGSVGL